MSRRNSIKTKSTTAFTASIPPSSQKSGGKRGSFDKDRGSSAKKRKQVPVAVVKNDFMCSSSFQAKANEYKTLFADQMELLVKLRRDATAFFKTTRKKLAADEKKIASFQKKY
jgi:hypothetical protein